MKKEVRNLIFRELRAAKADDGTRTITGYAVVFNASSVELWPGFTEKVDPGAFTRTLKEQPDVYCLYAHNSPAVLGRTKSGTLELNADTNGLHFRCTLPDTNIGRDLAVLVERGDVDGCSFGFYTIKDMWEEQPDGSCVRTLLDVDLEEISVTPFAAYPGTSVDVRSAPRELRTKFGRRPEIMRRAAGACQCECDECMADDCANCSDPDCADEQCRCARSVARSARSYTGDTQKVDGVDLTKDCFAYTPDDVPSHWKFPIHFPGNDEKTKTHIQNALARFDQADIPAAAKDEVHAKIVAAAKAHGIQVADDDRSWRDRMSLRLRLAKAKAF